ASYLAIGAAQQLVQRTGDLPVPLHLRNAPTRLMKELGHGKDYQYSHDQPGHAGDQEFLPEAISGTRLYTPGDNSREQKWAEHLGRIWKHRYR
ncbi:MAG TPA: replication-associated recombination protein A, partial [Flavobacteriales bacterium]|nr:replication-associated recombination protein A [Flavobacteriales bacterium]